MCTFSPEIQFDTQVFTPRLLLRSLLIVLLLMLIEPGLKSSLLADQLLDINTASPAMLAERLPGIGPAKAKAIVVYREQHGAFEKLDTLIQVKGIGPRTLEKIRQYLFVDKQPMQQSGNNPNPDPRTSQLAKDKRAKTAVRAIVNMAKRANANN